MTLFDEPVNPDSIYQINQWLMGVTLPGVLHEKHMNMMLELMKKSCC